MEVIPAIDISESKCVRLIQGRYSDKVVFDTTPLEAAKRFEAAGASRIHIVDLDASKSGYRVNADIVNQICSEVSSVKVQVGGGIRSLEDATSLLQQGADRVIFGTVAIENPTVVKQTVKKFHNDNVVISIDTENHKIKTQGWYKSVDNYTVEEFINRMLKIGVTRFIYTDIERDGRMAHPNFESVKKFVQNHKYKTIVAGGVSHIEDIIKLKALGVEGVIVGMAAHSGSLDIQEALKIASETTT